MAWAAPNEAEGRIIFPTALDVYRVRIEADKARLVLLSNGICRQRRFAGRPSFRGLARPFRQAQLSVCPGGCDLNRRQAHYRLARTPKIFADMARSTRPAAMGALKRSMAWDEEAFGLE